MDATEPVVELQFTREFALRVADEIMANYPEAGSGCALKCTRWKYEERKFTFIDEETDKKYLVDEERLITAFRLMLTGDKWPKGLQMPPASLEWERWEHWLGQDCDATDFDAFAQLATIGEVIYG